MKMVMYAVMVFPSNSSSSLHQFGDLKKMREKGIGMFGLFEESKQIGFVAIEKAADVRTVIV